MKLAVATLLLLAVSASALSTEMSLNMGAYEDPYTTSCSGTEKNVTIQGVSGAFCSPSCNGQGSACPAVPSGCTSQAQCVLETQGSNSPTNCAIICSPGGGANVCPQNAKCQPIDGVGICTYAYSG